MNEPEYETYVDDLAEPDCRFPVIITEHKEHVVWVDAESLEDAYKVLNNDPEWYERISDQETVASFWHDVRKPDAHDWDTVYPRYRLDGSYDGMPADAHVDAHRVHLRQVQWAAEVAACVEARHPNLRAPETYTTERYCPTCGWLKAEQVAA
jgi:hypothetical protein